MVPSKIAAQETASLIQPGQTGTRSDRRRVSALLFVLSMSTLALEIVQVRVFSFSINPIYVYMVISLALLGIGASGTALSIFPRLRAVPVERALPLCLVLFASTAALANAAFARLSHLMVADSGLTLFTPVAAIFLLFTVPYFFSGLGVAIVLLSKPEEVGRNYFINLIGNGAGCFVVYPFLTTLGADGVTLAMLAVTAVVGAAACWTLARRWAPLASVVASGLVVAFFFAPSVLPYAPDRSDFYATTVDRLGRKAGEPIEPERLFTRWDPVGRIDVYEFPGKTGLFSSRFPTYFFAQDAGAPSTLYGAGSHPELAQILGASSIYGIAASLRPQGEVLVVGLGGGPDLQATLAAGAGRVTGVEINGSVLEALGVRFRQHLGLPPPSDGRLVLERSDGRAYARRLEQRFDVIQMTGADTYAAGAVSGAILSENYLYTLEAFDDYFEALTPDGILAVTRFGLEPIKIVTTAATSLLAQGANRPSQHVAIVKQGGIWVLTLIKKSPFSEAEVEEIRRYISDAAARAVDFSLPFYDAMGFRMSGPLELLYSPHPSPDDPVRGSGLGIAKLLEAGDEGRLQVVIDEYEKFDFSPAADDRPFFLQLDRLQWPSFSELFVRNVIDNPLAWSINRYVGIVAQISAIALVLILGPLFALRRRGVALVSAAPLAVYFFGIGVGFMFVEIGLMQHLGLFLGHPNYSISTVLFSLLVFSGIGSRISASWGLGVRVTIGLSVAAIALGVALMSALSGGLIEIFLARSIATRIGVAVLMLAPISFFMGMPLPSMLRYCEERLADFAPWALGVNGFASVIASLATIPLTVAVGFDATFKLGALAYVIAWVAFVWIAWLGDERKPG